MKTLLFSTLYPSSVRSGHGIFVEKRLTELLATGQLDTRVVAPVPWFFSSHPRFGDYARWARTPAHETWHGLSVQHPRYLVLPKLGMSLSPFTLARAARPALARLLDEGFDFDVVDAHYFYPDGVAAALLARYFNKPLVITARGSDINLLAHYGVPRRLMQWAAAQASACVGVSPALTQRMAQLGFPADRLKVLPNGVDLAVFAPQAQAPTRTALAWPPTPTLLYVGHLVENKGPHLAIEALLHLPHFRLVLVGEGLQRAALERLAARLQLTSRVQFLGQLAPQQLALCYSAADILVLPSSREGWPNVLLEAMACGTPVVATQVGGVADIVAAPAAGQLMAERSVASLVQAVQALWRRRPAREAVRACALGHSWQATTQAQIALFNKVVQAGPHRAASLAPAPPRTPHSEPLA